MTNRLDLKLALESAGLPATLHKEENAPLVEVSYDYLTITLTHEQADRWIKECKTLAAVSAAICASIPK